MQEGVLGIIFNENKDQILLIQRQDVPLWALPGGGIDPGELPSESLVREVEEETGLHVEITRKAAEYFPINKLSAVTHVFEGKILSGTLKNSSETRACSFFPIHQLPKQLFHLHLDWIHDALANPLEIVKGPIYQVTYLRLLWYFLKHPFRVIKFLIAKRFF